MPENNNTEELQLATEEAPDITTLERIDAPAIWDGFRAELEKIKNTAETLTVTSVDQKKEIALARDTRLALKKIRVAVEHKRKELVEGLKKKAGAIDGDAREIRVVIERLETRLEEQEQFAIRAESERVAKLQEERSKRLLAVGGQPSFYPKLGEMPEEGFTQLIEGLEVADRLRKEREAKAEDERVAAAKAAEEARLAKEKADAEERAKIAAENEKLRKEAAEKEAALKAEREAAEKARKDALREREQEALRLQAIAEVERQKQAEAHRAEMEKAKAEREAQQKKAQADHEALMKKNAAEKKAREEAEEAVRRANQEAIDKQAAEAKARQDAAKAPDRDKLVAFAALLRALEFPVMTTDEGKSAVAKLKENTGKLADWTVKKSEEM